MGVWRGGSTGEFAVGAAFHEGTGAGLRGGDEGSAGRGEGWELGGWPGDVVAEEGGKEALSSGGALEGRYSGEHGCGAVGGGRGFHMEHTTTMDGWC